jgi:3-oxoacyl-[acyl-carrier-protein] synthase I
MGALSSAFNEEPARASRPLDKARDGFVFSGGAGVLVLEKLELAKARGAKIWAILDGAAATCDGEDMVLPSGKGAAIAMRLALEDAGIGLERIDYINLHVATSSRRTSIWTTLTRSSLIYRSCERPSRPS